MIQTIRDAENKIWTIQKDLTYVKTLANNLENRLFEVESELKVLDVPKSNGAISDWVQNSDGTTISHRLLHIFDRLKAAFIEVVDLIATNINVSNKITTKDLDATGLINSVTLHNSSQILTNNLEASSYIKTLNLQATGTSTLATTNITTLNVSGTSTLSTLIAGPTSVIGDESVSGKLTIGNRLEVAGGNGDYNQYSTNAVATIGNATGASANAIYMGLTAAGIAHSWIQAAQPGVAFRPLLINPNGGGVTLSVPASGTIPDGAIIAGNMFIYQTGGTLFFRVRDSGGVLRQGSITIT